MARKSYNPDVVMTRNKIKSKRLVNIIGEKRDKLWQVSDAVKEFYEKGELDESAYNSVQDDLLTKFEALSGEETSVFKKYTTKTDGKDAVFSLEQNLKKQKQIVQQNRLEKKQKLKRPKFKNSGSDKLIENSRTRAQRLTELKAKKNSFPKVEPTIHTLDLNYSVDGAGTRVNSRGKLGGGRKAGNNIKSRTKAGVGTGVETRNRLLPSTSNTGIVNDATKKPAAAAPKAGKTEHIYTVLDFETNGLKKGVGPDGVMPEVLSYSAKKYKLDLLNPEAEPKLFDEVEGFYKSKNGAYKGVEVHGLHDGTITERRAASKRKNMGASFDDVELKVLTDFINDGSDAVISHNGNDFDFDVIRGKVDPEKTKLIDTYEVAKRKGLKTGVRATGKNGDPVNVKTNTALHHRYFEELPDSSLLHDAANDVDITNKFYKEMVFDSNTGIAESLGLDTAKVKPFEPQNKHYYEQTAKDQYTKRQVGSNAPLPDKKVVEASIKAKEKAAAGVTKDDVATTARKFGDTLKEFKAATKKFGDDFSKMSTKKKAGWIGGTVATVTAGALLIKSSKERRKAELEKNKLITASVDKNRSGGW